MAVGTHPVPPVLTVLYSLRSRTVDVSQLIFGLTGVNY
jgi:hypothetical protein